MDWLSLEEMATSMRKQTKIIIMTSTTLMIIMKMIIMILIVELPVDTSFVARKQLSLSKRVDAAHGMVLRALVASLRVVVLTLNMVIVLLC